MNHFSICHNHDKAMHQPNSTCTSQKRHAPAKEYNSSDAWTLTAAEEQAQDQCSLQFNNIKEAANSNWGDSTALSSQEWAGQNTTPRQRELLTLNTHLYPFPIRDHPLDGVEVGVLRWVISSTSSNLDAAQDQQPQQLLAVRDGKLGLYLRYGQGGVLAKRFLVRVFVALRPSRFSAPVSRPELFNPPVLAVKQLVLHLSDHVPTRWTEKNKQTNK